MVWGKRLCGALCREHGARRRGRAFTAPDGDFGRWLELCCDSRLQLRACGASLSLRLVRLSPSCHATSHGQAALFSEGARGRSGQTIRHAPTPKLAGLLGREQPQPCRAHTQSCLQGVLCPQPGPSQIPGTQSDGETSPQVVNRRKGTPSTSPVSKECTNDSFSKTRASRPTGCPARFPPAPDSAGLDSLQVTWIRLRARESVILQNGWVCQSPSGAQLCSGARTPSCRDRRD